MAFPTEGTCLEVVVCDCSEPHYIDEPCPRCTSGVLSAVEERLAAALRREKFLLAFADHLLTRLATTMVGHGSS